MLATLACVFGNCGLLARTDASLKYTAGNVQHLLLYQPRQSLFASLENRQFASREGL